MTKEQLGDYTRRITQTNRTGLVVIIYEVMDVYLNEASIALEQNEIDDYVYNIKKARQFLNQLMNALDFKYKISMELLRVYRFVEDCLIKCELKRLDVNLQEVKEVLGTLRVAFVEVAKQDPTGAVMRNTQTVYEGFTYGRDGRNHINVLGAERYGNGTNLY